MTMTTDAMSVIPGLAALDAAAARVEAAREALSVPPHHGDIVAEVYAQLLDGQEVPADIGVRLSEAKHARNVAELAAGTLHQLGERFRRERVELIKNGADAALAVLQTQLDEILAQSRSAVDQLGAVRTAEDAVRAGDASAAAWRTLGELAGRYHQLREEQSALVKHRVPDEQRGYLLREFGELAGRVALWPPDERHQTSPPWPCRPGGQGEPARDVPFLIWLVENLTAAAPWVPTTAQLSEAAEAYKQASRGEPPRVAPVKSEERCSGYEQR